MKIKYLQSLVDYKVMKDLAFRNDFTGYGMTKEDCPSGLVAKESFYWFKDNGAKVLAVAHLDSVVYENHFEKITIQGQDTVYCSRFDDRIGVYIILDMLPKLGVNVDWLLTTDEEVGASTAEFFETEKSYNWIVEFDRRGTDVVLYQFEDKDIVDALSSVKFKIGIGSFSDIASLDHLGVKAFNVGTGVEKEHSAWCSVNVFDMTVQLRKFYNFYSKYKDTHFPHSEYKSRSHRTSLGTGRYYPLGAEAYDWTDEYYYNRNMLDRDKGKKADFSCAICHLGPPDATFENNYEGYEDVCDFCIYYVDTCKTCKTVTLYENLNGNECYTCIGKRQKKLENDCTWCGDLKDITCQECKERKASEDKI